MLNHFCSGERDEAQKQMRAARTGRRPDVEFKKLPTTLIVWGVQDGSVGMERAVSLCQQLPESQLHVFNNCGHWPQWEYPDAFNSLVSQFARRCRILARSQSEGFEYEPNG